MTLDQIIVTWILMLLQGVRRLYESLEFTKPSNARMWIGHWALGVWFYASMSIAVWIEGARMFWPGRNPCLTPLTFFSFSSNSSPRVIQFLAFDYRASLPSYFCGLLDFHPCFWCATRLPRISCIFEEVQCARASSVPTIGLPSLLCRVSDLSCCFDCCGSSWIPVELDDSMRTHFRKRKSRSDGGWNPGLVWTKVRAG